MNQRPPAAILARRRNRLNGLIGKTERQLKTSLRWAQWLYAPLGPVFWLLIGWVAVSFGFLIWGNNPGMWQPITIFACFFLIYAAIYNPGWEAPRYVAQETLAALIAVRRAAVVGDNAVAPLAAQQPASPSATLTQSGGRLAKLPIPIQRTDLSWIWIGMATQIFYAFSLLLSPRNTVVIIVFCLLLFANVIYPAQEFYRRRWHRLHITILPEGLAWRRGWAHGLVRWQAIRALCIDTPNSITLRQRTYLIDAGDTTLAWTTTIAATREELAATETLLQQISTHTGVPLHDITQALKQIVETTVRPPRRWRVRSPLAYALSLLLAALIIAAGIALSMTIHH